MLTIPGSKRCCFG